MVRVCKKFGICNSGCNLVYIIKDHIKPLMQLLTIDLKQYNMRLLTTKCLNSAVLIMYFMLGKRGIDLAQQCDTKVVIERHTNGIDNNYSVITALKKDILSKNIKQRYLYYILLTDGHFPKSDPSSNEHTIFFPGHVFILEKTPSDDEGIYFQVYQSYINHYDIKGHFQNNHNSVKMSMNDIAHLMDKLKYILESEKWDNKCVEYWKDFTFVDTSQFKDSHSKNKFFLCYRKSPVKMCLQNIKRFAKQKITTLSKIPEQFTVYGDQSLYDDKQKPLSTFAIVSEMKNVVQKLENYSKLI